MHHQKKVSQNDKFSLHHCLNNPAQNVKLEVVNVSIHFQENRYIEQNQEVTLELLALLKEQYDIILLAFPGEERHYEIEDLVYGVRYRKCCKILSTFLFLFSNKMWKSKNASQKSKQGRP